MSEPEFHESVVVASRRSKVLALFVAIAVFLPVTTATGDIQFSSIVAAGAAIGARFYWPYRASIKVPESERTPLSEHPAAGNYHHGAAGIALMIASALAVAVFLVAHAFLTAIAIGGVLGVGSYFMLRSQLPA
ncbi:hypothetical protein [Halorubrum vacuolatum]|nr:hypothetical protein [Halorubrum vacuolatum]